MKKLTLRDAYQAMKKLKHYGTKSKYVLPMSKEAADHAESRPDLFRKLKDGSGYEVI